MFSIVVHPAFYHFTTRLVFVAPTSPCLSQLRSRAPVCLGPPKDCNCQVGHVTCFCAKVWSDTGCSSVVVRRSLVPNNKLTGQEALCSLIDGTIRRTPVAKIFVQTPYYTGLTTAVCMLNPIYDLIVGNIRGATEPNPSPHLTGAMSVTILEGPEPETSRPLQQDSYEEPEVEPQEVTYHDAREHTHLKLKIRTSKPPISRLPDVTWIFILLAVVLCIGIGAVLLQRDSAGEKRPIASRQLQPYRFLLRAIRGRDNVGADCLSRNPLDDDPVE